MMLSLSESRLRPFTLRAKQDALRQKMAEDIQQNAFNMERNFGRELEEIKAQLNHQITLNHKLSTEPVKKTSISTALALNPWKRLKCLRRHLQAGTAHHFLGLINGKFMLVGFFLLL